MRIFNWLRRRIEKGRTLADLADWLALPEAELARWSNDGRPNGYTYRSFRLRKRSGRGHRQIDAPNKLLLALQQRVYHKVLKRLPIHQAATGFVPGKSIVDNARPHVGQEVVINIDLKDFFPTIKKEQVYNYFHHFGWGTTAADVLANICCHRGCLPQGAPTSPALSNLLNLFLDARLAGLTRKLGGRYTRYADDLTFSFASFGSRERRLIPLVKQILADEGYEIQKKKRIRVQRPHQQQTATGLVVNETINLPRATRRKIRALRHHQEMGTLSRRDQARLAGYEGLAQMVEEQRGGGKVKSET